MRPSVANGDTYIPCVLLQRTLRGLRHRTPFNVCECVSLVSFEAFLAFFAIANCQLREKNDVIERFLWLVSDFLNYQQLSKAVDIVALGIHKGENASQIRQDVERYLKHVLEGEQLALVTQSYSQLTKELGKEKADAALARAAQIVGYTLEAPMRQIQKTSATPSAAYAMMSQVLNPELVLRIKIFVREMMPPEDFDAIRKHLSPQIVKLQ
ncbi:unnamed protein product [Caenorhabditis auriculariae]|uniref:Uncharacterized protein n=1 Tax=Caenorhabditis auriculariae TaxID=2777116 RepID=A0A8S1HGN5_9PELO|nr:unnamed protein product [Caenorhabditis auriculariae]